MTEPMSVYDLFIQEVDAMRIDAADSAVHLVGMLTRAAKRAQLVHDGELAPVVERASDPDRYR